MSTARAIFTGPALRILVFIGLIGAFGLAAHSQTTVENDSISISGDLPTLVTLKAADLDKMPQETVSQEDEDGNKIEYGGVLLKNVLEKAGAPSGRSLRGKGLASYIVAKARDDYEVVFTLAEMDPAFGNEKIVIVYKKDGKPLALAQGPFRLVCPADKAGARSVRMLKSIEFVKLKK